jgi:hypothetical protein
LQPQTTLLFASIQPLKLTYSFTLPKGDVKHFDVLLDDKTLSMKVAPRTAYPEWTALEFKKCPNCPLEIKTPRCPVAANIVDLADFFKEAYSYEEARVEITTEARTFTKKARVSEGLRSLVGIYMATSGCPVLDKLRPMVGVHLPFATFQETLYRTTSMYLLAQFFLGRHGGKPDWDLENLAKIYESISAVNHAFCERLRQTTLVDAMPNALVELDTFAQMTTRALRKKNLDALEGMFSAYLPPKT